MADSSLSIQQKVSFKFAKLNAARYFSHHDIMRHFERSLKRAGLEVKHTEGFNPRPRMVFPHPLPLGVSSECEEIEVEFSRFYPLKELFSRLSAVLKPCIDLLGITTLKAVRKGRIVNSCTYRIENFPDHLKMAEATDKMLQAEEIFLERGHGKKRREIELKRFIDTVVIEENALLVKLHHFTYGAGRIDEVGKYLAKVLDIDWQSLSFTKVEMELKQ